MTTDPDPRRALVVGAGAVGARAARQLVSSGFAVQVAEPRRERRSSVVSALGPQAAAFDGDPAEPGAAAGADVAVLCHGRDQHAPLATALVRRGVPVVSVSEDPDDVNALLDLHEMAETAGVPLAVGAGFSPGLTCLLAAHGASLLDRVTEIHVARAGTGGPACAHRHHQALGSGPALDWRDGAWVRRAAGSGRELCWFPDPIGGRDCYRAGLAEPQLLVRVFPDAQRVTARLAANRRDRLTSRLPMLRAPHEDGGPGGVRVELRGDIEGQGSATVVYGAMDVPSMASGAVAALTAELLVAGEHRRTGAGGLAELLEPLPALRQLAERGVKAAVFTG